MRKWREIHFLHFLLFSFFPPSLSIFYIKNSHILSGRQITKSGCDDGNMKCKLFLVGVNWKDDRNLQIGEVPS